jgi:general secretion pathway protein K
MRFLKGIGAGQKNSHEEGSAVILALIVIGVATVLLSGLMWRQQVQIRTVENMRDRAQALWLVRSALDFARLVLARDQSINQYDHLGEAWALPLADSKVADFLKSADLPSEIQGVTVLGQLTDAQSRFNIIQLWDGNLKNINVSGVEAYARILDALGLDRNLAQQTAQGVLKSDLPLSELRDLLRLPFYSSALLAKISPYVVVLPIATSVNINTATVEALMGAVAGLSRSAANNIVQQRATTPVKSLEEVGVLLQNAGTGKIIVDPAMVNVQSYFFLAQVEVKFSSSSFLSTALIQRSPNPLSSGNFTQVVWNKMSKGIQE